MGEYHTYTTMKYLVVQSYNIPIFSMPSFLTCKNAYNVHARSNVIQYHTEYHSAPTNVFCVHYICSRYRSLLWDIAPIALCATTIQCRTQKCGTTHSLVWEAPPLVWHNGLGTWAGLANVEITLKWKHSAAGKTIQQQRQPSWDLNWRRLADNRSRLGSCWENIHSTYRGIHRVGSYRSLVLPYLVTERDDMSWWRWPRKLPQSGMMDDCIWSNPYSGIMVWWWKMRAVPWNTYTSRRRGCPRSRGPPRTASRWDRRPRPQGWWPRSWPGPPTTPSTPASPPLCWPCVTSSKIIAKHFPLFRFFLMEHDSCNWLIKGVNHNNTNWGVDLGIVWYPGYL